MSCLVTLTVHTSGSPIVSQISLASFVRPVHIQLMLEDLLGHHVIIQLLDGLH